jgi:hypothetical protein
MVEPLRLVMDEKRRILAASCGSLPPQRPPHCYWLKLIWAALANLRACLVSLARSPSEDHISLETPGICEHQTGRRPRFQAVAQYQECRGERLSGV